MDEWKSALISASIAGFSVLEIQGGETLLRAQLVLELIRFAHGIRHTRLWTNGILLQPDFVDNLQAMSLNVSLMIQVVSDRAELHEEITGSERTFDQLLTNIAYVKASRVPFAMIVPLIQRNEARKDYMYETFKSLGADKFFFQPTIIHGHDIPGKTADRITINWHGDVLSNACSRLKPLGNVRNADLADVLSNTIFA